MRSKLIIGIVVVLLLVSAGAAFWYVNWNTQPTPTAPTIEQPTDSTLPQVPSKPTLPPVVPLPPTPQPVVTKVDPADIIKNLTQAFAERYGSYSTDLPYDNIRQALPFAAPGFQQELNELLQRASAQGVSAAYMNVSTRALYAEVVDISETSAAVVVTVQRSQRTARVGEPFTFYSNLNVSLIKVNEEWLVASARWTQ